MDLEVLVRDDRGMVLAVHSRTLEGRLDSSLVETRAVLLEVQICNELGFTRNHSGYGHISQSCQSSFFVNLQINCTNSLF
jgi:hypothetical protein